MSFLHRDDKQEILSRRADLEAEGVRVKMKTNLQCSKIFNAQVTEDMADSQVEGWLKLGKLQEQVTEKYPNVQVRSRLSMVSASIVSFQWTFVYSASSHWGK